MSTIRSERVRRDFPVLAREIDGLPIRYLDSAATSLKPEVVIDEVVRYYREVGANIHRGKHYLSEEASTRYEQVRYRVGQFLRVPSNEIVFVANATHGLELVASGLGLTSDDLVLVPLDAHHSNLIPWRRVARVEFIRLDATGVIDLDQYRALLRRHPRVVALSHCSNVTGIYAPLDQMIPMAKQAGAVVVVDAAQSMPHRRLPIKEMGGDFMVFSGHKMLAPTGTGVLWGRFEALQDLRPLAMGGGTVDWVDTERHDMRAVPHRFEAGTPHIAGIYGLGRALDYLDSLGRDALVAHDAELSAHMLAQAVERPWLELLGGTHAERAAIASFEIAGFQRLADIARILSDSYGIMCRTGHMCAQPLVDHYADGEVLRISAYVYNTIEDIDAVFTALDEIRESFAIEDAVSTKRG